MDSKCILILGGARSGKSQFAQKLAGESGKKVLFVATAETLDEEMREKIFEHKSSRPSSWQVLESPTELGKKIPEKLNDAEVVIVDCITLLISNILTGEEEKLGNAKQQVEAEIKELIDSINETDARFIIISNEVGLGIVPENKLSRVYRDLLGKANQALAAYADEVFSMLAGIPIKVK